MTDQNTPILRCTDFSSISIQPSQPSHASSSSHRLDSPIFTVPPSIIPHLAEASRHLHAGRTVAVPTETVYGLAASSLNPEAVKAIYRIKNRPSDNPLIIHISSLDMLRTILPPSYELSPLYIALIEAFWPGPLSLLFPSPNPPPLPAPQTNAIRMPSHPLALALIHHSNLPLSAPSANSSGRPSPTCAQHVYNDLNRAEGLGCILDGGDCGVGVESTVVNGLGWKQGGGGCVDVLRPGGLGVEEIARIVERVDGKAGLTEILLHGKPWHAGSGSGSSAATAKPTTNGLNHPPLEKIKKAEPALPPSTPGMKYRHYSPRVPVFLLKPSNTFPRPALSSEPEAQATAAGAEADSSAQAVLRQITQRILPVSSSSKIRRVGLLHFDHSPLSQQLDKNKDEQVEIIRISLGTSAASAAQRLFAGMLALEGKQAQIPVNLGLNGDSAKHADNDPVQTFREGVDAILIEGCSDQGLGLAVMERVSKAVGGGGLVGELHHGEKGSGDGNIFWVDVGEAA